MTELTEKEYDALDEYWTANTPKLSGNGKGGFFAKHAQNGEHVMFVDELTAKWLRIKATNSNTTPEAIVSELVRKEIVATTA